ncbi:uncharacterized protein PAC_18938 [Phialocephala subalpina]|uniref:Transcription factor domain-containing protein n=1 Tax=Phialocephala subalpina TaxID=576137 RepID=A0A1L7XVK9_9HELO|nr:uncharacterized protein PAC_18938 [Phialocephala subalpina]
MLDTQKIKTYTRAFFENPHLGSTYISQQKLQRLTDQLTFDGSSLQGADRALLYAALATGCDHSSTLGNHAEARAYYRVAADLTWNMISGPLDITKLQALTTMVGILFILGSATKESLFFLVSSAVNMIQTLGFYTESAVERISSNAKDQLCIKHLVWTIASIEGLLGLRYGHESASNGVQPYFHAFCEFGHIFSRIYRTTRTDASKDDVSQLQSLLNDWKSSFSIEVQQQDELQIWFHEAILSLALMSFVSKSTPENTSSKSMLEYLAGSDLTLSSARNMLRSLTLTAPMKETSHIIRLMVISWCIVFSAILHGQGGKDDLALLSLVSALFARLSLSRSVDCGFHEISQLGGVAASMLLTKRSSVKEAAKGRGVTRSFTSAGADNSQSSGPRSHCADLIDQQQNMFNSQETPAPDPSISPLTAITAFQSNVLDSWASDATIDELLQIDTAFGPSWESHWENHLMLQDLNRNADQRPDQTHELEMKMVC